MAGMNMTSATQEPRQPLPDTFFVANKNTKTGTHALVLDLTDPNTVVPTKDQLVNSMILGPVVSKGLHTSTGALGFSIVDTQTGGENTMGRNLNRALPFYAKMEGVIVSAPPPAENANPRGPLAFRFKQPGNVVLDEFIANLDAAFSVRSAKDMPGINVDQKTIGYRGINQDTGLEYEDRLYLAQVFPSNGGIMKETISDEGGVETKTYEELEVHEMRKPGTHITAFFEVTEAFYNKTAKQKGVRLTLCDTVVHELGSSDNNNAQPNLFGYTPTKNTTPAFSTDLNESLASF